MLTPTTKAKYRDPITRAEVKTRLEITATGDDALIDELIGEARDEIEVVLGRTMARTSWNEKLAGRGRMQLDLSAFPIDGTETANLTVKVHGDTITVANEEYFVENEDEGILFRASRWPHGEGMLNGDGTARVEADYIGGWVMPGAIGDWTASATYAVGQWVRPTDLSTSVYLMECTTAGDADATEPAWAGKAAGATVVDNTVTWTVRRAWELPRLLQQIAWLAVLRGYGRERPELIRVQAEGFSETYGGGASGMAGALLRERDIRSVQRYAR